MNEKEIVNDEKDINFNQTECLTSYDTWGTTHYVNVCNDTTKDVPWGLGGFLAFWGIVVLIIFLVSLASTLVAFIIDSYRW